MSIKKNFSILASLIIACLPLGSVYAIFGIDPTNGYRYDKLSNLIDVYDPEDTLVATDELKLENMRFYQLGIREKWTFCDFVLHVEGDYAWLDKGKYKEIVTNIQPSATGVGEAHIHKGKAKDLIVGLGYGFSLYNCFNISGLAGWSYHMLEIKTKHGTFDGEPDPVLNGLRYNNRWQGPWLGVDLGFNAWIINFHAGYEYHWADWHATWRLDGPDVPKVAFSDRRKASNAHGQVLYFDGNVNFCSVWSIGVGIKLQEWKATHGHEKPLHGSFADVGLPETEVDIVKHAKWSSYAITCDLGYLF